MKSKHGNLHLVHLLHVKSQCWVDSKHSLLICVKFKLPIVGLPNCLFNCLFSCVNSMFSFLIKYLKYMQSFRFCVMPITGWSILLSGCIASLKCLSHLFDCACGVDPWLVGLEAFRDFRFKTVNVHVHVDRQRIKFLSLNAVRDL